MLRKAGIAALLLTCGLVGLVGARVVGAAERRTPIVEAIARVAPAVATVRVEMRVSRTRADPFDWFFRDFAGPRRERLETVSQGSSVIIDPKGYVLTNYHVIEGGGAIALELADGRALEASVVGTAPDHDLAVLRATSKQALPHVPMGTSRDLMIGETVIAVGNPFGLSHTVTTGVVSALHRSIKTDERVYADFIQTDASINPGNSGGPLVNINGELVGVNTAIYAKAQGIGFAIPIDKAKRIVSDLIAHGEVRRPYFGFETQELTAQLAESFGLTRPSGALVTRVDAKGPAAGRLRDGDIITEVDGVRIVDVQDLRHRLWDFTVGASVPMRYLRDGRIDQVTVRPRELDSDEALRDVTRAIGITVEELTADEARRSGLPAGALVIGSVARQSPAERGGIRRGDWLRAVNEEPTLGLKAFGQAMARCYWQGHAILLIQRGRLWQQFSFKL